MPPPTFKATPDLSLYIDGMFESSATVGTVSTTGYGNDVDCELCGAWVVFYLAAKLEEGGIFDAQPWN